MSSSFNPAIPYVTDTRARRFPWLNVILFVLTCGSTLFVGAVLMADFHGTLEVFIENLQENPFRVVASGFPFSIAIMSILFSHEMGHYLTCRYYGIDASLPYFIPFPSIVGTMGAFIRIRSPIGDRGSLLEMGIAGPIAGFIVAVAVLVLSIGHGRFVTTTEGGAHLGTPLIYTAVEYLAGMTPPAGMETYLHPASFAAWFGFLATTLNLLPAAQLDGGHVIYAIFRGHHRRISLVVVLALIPLAIFYWLGWLLWIVLLLILRLYHPPTLDDQTPIRPRHIVLGLAGLAIFILCFMPAPFPLSLIGF